MNSLTVQLINSVTVSKIVNITKFGDFQNWKGKLKAVTNM